MYMEANYKIILTPTLTKMDDGTIRIIFSKDGEDMVSLYYEKAKKGWTNKPIMPQAWRCVEGKVFNPNIYEDGTVEPKDLVGWGQELIFTSMNIFSVKEIGKSQQ
jgi:hypothetical protein